MKIIFRFLALTLTLVATTFSAPLPFVTTTVEEPSFNGRAGDYCKLVALADGRPAIAYYDSLQRVLKFSSNSAIDASGPWTSLVVESVGQRQIENLSVAIVDGFPAIAYRDAAGNGRLHYVRATNAEGTAWSAPLNLADGGGDPSLAMVNGRPAISYWDSVNGGLRFIRASNAAGTAWGAPFWLDGLGGVGLYGSLVVVNGNPAVSYHDSSSGDLKYIRATDANGAIWGVPQVLDSTGIVGAYTSMAVINGHPAISYYDQTKASLKYIRAADADGTTWNAALALDGGQFDAGLYTCLTVVAGNPMIAYRETPHHSNKTVRATDPNGENWGSRRFFDPVGDTGYYNSLGVMGGYPVLVYFRKGTGDLKYGRSTVVDGSSGWTAVTVDSGLGSVGRGSSQAVINGNPAISYYDYGPNQLKFARANDAHGFGTWTTVVATGVGGESSSLAVINGRPAIASYNPTEGKIRYDYGKDANGTTWSDSTLAIATGSQPSLAAVNVNPAISYFATSASDLRYLRSESVFGDASSWTTSVTVDGVGVVGQYSSLAVVNGNPAISYYDATNGNLKYVRASNGNGTTWGTPVVVESAGDVGWFTSLKVVNGNPAIAYYDVTNGVVKYVRANDASGTTWGTPVTLGAAGADGQAVTLAVIEGNPAVSFYDPTSGTLKYARASDASGATPAAWGAAITVDSAGTVGHTPFLMALNGRAAISYYDVTRTALKWAGPPSLDANLANLVSSTGPLSPVFAAATLAYEFTVPNATASLTVSPTTATTFSTVQVRVNGGAFETVASGSPSSALALQVGANAVEVVVTAQDQATQKTYTLTVNRLGLPLIGVAQAGPIANGGSQAFGTLPVGTSSATLTFTVTNTGPVPLTLTSLGVIGGHAGDFAVNTFSTVSTLPANTGSTTFTVTFTPSAAGPRTTTLRIGNDDPARSPYDITLSGAGLSFAADTDGDGLNDASEFQMAALGFDWQVPQPALVATLYNNASGAGLYTSAQVQAIHVGAPLITKNRETGIFTLTIALQKATDLNQPGNFVPFPFLAPQTAINPQGQIEFQFTVPDAASFFLLKAQ